MVLGAEHAKLDLFQFDHWTDVQRKRVLEDLLSKCKSKQLEFTGEATERRGKV